MYNTQVLQFFLVGELKLKKIKILIITEINNNDNNNCLSPYPYFFILKKHLYLCENNRIIIF